MLTMLTIALLVAVVAIVTFASPCFIFASQASIELLDQLDQHLGLH